MVGVCNMDCPDKENVPKGIWDVVTPEILKQAGRWTPPGEPEITAADEEWLKKELDSE